MRYEVAITSRAERELNEAADWIAAQAPEAAARWYHGFVQAIIKLGDNPLRCAIARESAQFPYQIRELLYGRLRHLQISCLNCNGAMNDYHINIFYSDDDGGYIADIPDLEACSAFGKSPEEALRELQIAKEAWLAAAKAENKPIPVPQFRPVAYQAVGE